MMMAAGLDPSLAEFDGEVPRGTRRWFAVVLALAAGWGALFAYSTIFLSEDPPLRPAPTLSEATAFDFPVEPRQPPAVLRPVARSVEAAPPARTLAEPKPFAEAKLAPETKLAAEAKPSDADVTSPRAEYVGVWGPNPAACGVRSRRRGYIPATISPERAQAGRTICSFHDGHRSGNTWVMAADCSDRGRRWSSQVRLVVEGDRLTWSSAKGSASYVRCGRRAG